MSSHDFKLLIKNASQLVTISSDPNVTMKTGKDMDQIEIIENGAVVVGNDGTIIAVGTTQDVLQRFDGKSFAQVLDATGRSIVPGLVDGHTHPVWSGDRVHEFAMKLAGATYMQIHAAGGGIGFTVRHTREASQQELENLLVKRIKTMIRNGTTTAECKSGYGLNMDTEIKMLRVVHQVKQQHPEIELVANYLGAHSVPKDKTLDDYTKEIIEQHIPEIQKLMKSGEISPEFIDVFHEQGVFGGEQTKQILLAGKAIGLDINFHGDELHPMKSAELAAEIGATAVSHLECISDEGIAAMSSHKIVAVLLPTTAYILRIEYPPARKMIEHGVPVALASDFNPNAHCMSLPFVMNLACVQMRMTMNEALVASTLNAAAALKRGATHGSIAVGKIGDFVVVDSAKWEHLVYELGDAPISHVVKRGNIVYHTSL